MKLTVPQLLQRLKLPVNGVAIQQARNHEDRVKLHTKSVDTKDKASAYFPEFIKWVSDGIKLPSDKMEAFRGMCQFPLPTTALCNSIFDEYEKIFTAQDSFFDVEMLDDTLKADYKEYLDDTLKIHSYFQTKGFEEFKKQPGCIYVVDVAKSQFSMRPEPYFVKVSLMQVHDIEIQRVVDGTKRIGLIIYKTGADQYHCIDDEAYRLFTKLGVDDWRLDIDVMHPLEYTPAKFLLSSALYDEDDNSPVARKTMLSDSLGDLDWLLAYSVFMRMYETYGPFPIMTVPEKPCDYVDAYENVCRGGYVSGTTLDGVAYSRECPSCKKNSIVGPGTIYGRPVPRSKDEPQLVNAVEITPADVDSLDYISKKIDYLEREIFANNVGDTDTTITTQAVNEKQVQSNVEGRKNILSKVKKEIELTKGFLVDTIGRLRYAQFYVGCTVNMGEQWLLLSADEMTLQYMNAKKSGLPGYLVNQKKKQYVQTEYRNNPTMRQRASLLDLLEPWPDLSIAECTAYQLNLLFPDKFYLKLDFAKFISKFELLNGDIVQWGSALSMDKKIENLTLILLDYGKSESTSATPLPSPTGPGGSK